MKYHDEIGERIFDVLVEEDVLVLNDFDILRTTSGTIVPLVVQIPTVIDIIDGTVTIDFVENIGDPQINAIEVIFMKMIAPSSPVTSRVPSNPKSTIPTPTSVTQENAPTKLPTKPSTNQPTTLPFTPRPTSMPEPNVSTDRPTNIPWQTPVQGPILMNVTTPTTAVPVGSSFTNIPNAPMIVTVRPILVPMTKNSTLVVEPLNSTRPPNFRYTRAPTRTPLLQLSQRPTTNTSNAINTTNTTPVVAVPIKAPVVPNTTVPVHRPLLQPPVVVVGNILHRINCGSTHQVIVPPNQVVWTPDQYVTNGQSYNSCGNSIDDTKNPSQNISSNITNANSTTSIYCTSRYFRWVDQPPYRYELPVPVSNRTYSEIGRAHV